MQPNWTNFTVGQKVYYVPYSSERNRYIEVERVGYKWAYFGGMSYDYRVEIGTSTVMAQSFGATGTLYENEATYQDYVDSQKRITALSKVDWRSLPVDKVNAVWEILNHD